MSQLVSNSPSESKIIISQSEPERKEGAWAGSGKEERSRALKGATENPGTVVRDGETAKSDVDEAAGFAKHCHFLHPLSLPRSPRKRRMSFHCMPMAPETQRDGVTCWRPG